MFHKDQKAKDVWETLCHIKEMTIRRFRMSRTSELMGVKSGGSEVLVVSMKGGLSVTMSPSNQVAEIGEKDICYVPKGETCSLKKRTDSCEVVVATAPATTAYTSFVKRFSDAVPIESGKAPFFRKVYNMISESDKVDRFLGGFVEGDSGNWTSFPPHRHDGKPELYVYYGLGEKFGVQMVLTKGEDAAYVVREGDAVLFEKGYHPNVAAPGTGMNFLWIISAPPESRDLSVEFHPAFEGMQSGPTHLKTAAKKS